jgi:hypothetical protein
VGRVERGDPHDHYDGGRMYNRVGELLFETGGQYLEQREESRGVWRGEMGRLGTSGGRG